MKQNLAGDTARPQDFVFPAAVVTGGFGIMMAVIQVAGQDYSRDGIALGALFVVAACAGCWMQTAMTRGHEESAYAEIILGCERAAAEPGRDAVRVQARIEAMPSRTTREKIMLIAEGQIARAAAAMDQSNVEEIRRLAKQVREDTGRIVQTTAGTEQPREDLLSQG